MWGANIGSSYALPFRVIPARGQVSQNSLHSPSKQSCDVFHDNVPRSKFANDSCVLTPESRAFAVDADSLAGVADVLAGESSTNDVNRCEIVFPAFSDVVKALRSREVPCEDTPSVIFNFDLPDGFNSRSFKAKVESSDTTEQTPMLQTFPFPDVALRRWPTCQLPQDLHL
jgi:hypothetical protein